MDVVRHEAVGEWLELVALACRLKDFETSRHSASAGEEGEPPSRHKGEVVRERPSVPEILESGRLSQFHRLGRAEALQLHQSDSAKCFIHVPQEETVIE